MALAQSWLPTSIPWIPCFQDIGPQFNVTWQCANLTVPVDYLDSTDNKTTQLGIAWAHPNELESPQGALFSNPGGPSGAYLASCSSSAEYSDITVFATLLTPFLTVTHRKYDIILVDPRGVGWSKFLTCGFTSNTLTDYNEFIDIYQSTVTTNAAAISRDTVLKLANVTGGQYGPFCEKAEDQEYLAHVNTPNVARDLDLVRNLTGHATFDYWGFSYGTALGSMYAAMFPEKVGRMVIDGVLNFAEWTGSVNSLDFFYSSQDQIPRILGIFANYCVEAAQMNPQYCTLAAASMNSSDPLDHLQDRIENVISNLTQYSFTNATGNATYTFYNFVGRTRTALMQPRSNFFPYAKYLLNIEKAIQANLTITSPPSSIRARSLIRERGGPPANTTYAALTEPNDPLGGLEDTFDYPAVVCLDNSFVGIDTLDTWMDQIYSQIETNPLIAYMGIPTSACLGWPNLTAYDLEIYKGPFPAKLNNKMLVLGGVNDPVTPYHGALATYEYIGSDNAIFLIHDGVGHCSTSNNNTCTTAAMTSYFVNGTLPANGTECVSNNTGPNNFFALSYNAVSGNNITVKNVAPANDSGNDELLALGLGLGLGLRIPFLIGFGILIGYFLSRPSRGRTETIDAGTETEKDTSSVGDLHPVA